MSFTNDRMAIYSYSRQQAIDDGVLVDITEMAQEAGFRFPVARNPYRLGSHHSQPYRYNSKHFWKDMGYAWMLRLAVKSGMGKSEIFFLSRE